MSFPGAQDNSNNNADIAQMIMGIDNTVQWGLLYQMMFIRLLNLHSMGKDKEARTLFDNMVGHFYGIFDATFVKNCKRIDLIVEEPEFKAQYTPEQRLNQAFWLRAGELSRLMVRSGHAPKPDVMLIPDVTWEVPKDLTELSLSGESKDGPKDEFEEEEDDIGTQYISLQDVERVEQEALNILTTPIEQPPAPAPAPFVPDTLPEDFPEKPDESREDDNSVNLFVPEEEEPKKKPVKVPGIGINSDMNAAINSIIAELSPENTQKLANLYKEDIEKQQEEALETIEEPASDAENEVSEPETQAIDDEPEAEPDPVTEDKPKVPVKKASAKDLFDEMLTQLEKDPLKTPAELVESIQGNPEASDTPEEEPPIPAPTKRTRQRKSKED
jgi:hypothetical protein